MSRITNNLTEEEFDALVNLKEEHYPYFSAMMYAMSVIVERNHKYTGEEEDRNVFANFILDADIQRKSVGEIFRQWVSKKTARVMLNNKDYADESFHDSLRDLANFSLLYVGWLFHNRKDIHPEHDLTRPSEPDMEIEVKGLIDDETFKQPYILKYLQSKNIVGRVKDNIR